MPTSPIRIVVVDDHRSYRAGLIITLSREDDLVVVGEGETATDAISQVMLKAPDLVLIDLNMPGGGIAAATKIAMMRPGTRTVIITMTADDEVVERARMLGMAGYILKGCSAHELLWQIRAAAHGGSVWPGEHGQGGGIARRQRP